MNSPQRAPRRRVRWAAFAGACLVVLRATGAPPLRVAGHTRVAASLATAPAASPPATCPHPPLLAPFTGPLAVRGAYRSGNQWRFCPRLSTFGAARVGRRPHGGVDLSAPTGTPVRAATNGELTFARDPRGYGFFARLTFAESARSPGGACEPGGEVQVVYGHLIDESPGRAVAPRVVRAGEIIGHVGCTGNARGMCSPSPESHLHVTLQRDSAGRFDPVEYTGWPVGIPAESERPTGWAPCL